MCNNKDIQQMLHELRAEREMWRDTLANFLNREASLADARLLEYVLTDVTATQTLPNWRAQTNDLEIVRGILVVLPVGTTSATLALGDKLVIPIQNTMTCLSPLSWPIVGQKRQLTYAPAGQAMALVWADPAPNLVPGVLHP